jgi:phosphoglycolate phosphatase-like HAD superfamily hydrolase
MTAENSRRPKPAPDPLLEIIEHFNCSIDETLYVGDSVIDEQTARSCDMRLVAFRNKQLRAEYHVETFREILQLQPFLEY